MQLIRLAVVAILFCASSVWAADWPQWLGPNRDGKSADTGLLKEWPAGGPKLLWKLNDIGRGYSGVAVADGMIYITGDTDQKTLLIHALDLNGQRKWTAVHDAAWTGSYPGSRATPTIDGENLYLLSGNGVVGCYDTKRGQPKWKHNLKQFGGQVPGWGYAESVLIDGDRAIVTAGGNNCIVAFDKKTGRPLWSSTGFNGKAHYGSLIAIEHEKTPMIIAGTGGGIAGFDAKNGRVLWSDPFCTANVANCPTPAYADGYVFWSNGYGKGSICMKLTGRGAEVAWKSKDIVSHHGGYVIEKGYIYGNTEGGFTCLELKSGNKQWFERAVGKGSLVWADGMLYLFGEKDGKVALGTCSPEGLQIKGQFSVQGEGPSWAHPVVAGGRLYLRYDTNLYCYDVKAQ